MHISSCHMNSHASRGGLTRVQAPLGVELGVTGELGVADGQDLDPDQLGDAEGQCESGPRGAVQLDLASINPGGGARDRVSNDSIPPGRWQR